MSRHIPNAWDDDITTWESPSPAGSSTPPAPPITLAANSQPKTLYRPELKILRRNAPSAPAPRAPQASKTKQEVDAERKARERRYKEVRDKIFNGTESAPTTRTASPVGKVKESAQTTRTTSPAGKAKEPVVAVRQTQAQDDGGVVLGMQGTLRFAPVPERERKEWQFRQVALDGKMLESEAVKYGFVGEEREGDVEGMGWEEGRRKGRGEERREEEPDRWREQREVVAEAVERPVREPRGPESGAGRGFGARRGGRGKPLGQ